MGQTISKEEIKEEIEKQLNICFLSLNQEDIHSKNSISFNLSTVSAHKGSIDFFFNKTSNNNSLIGSNGFINISNNNIIDDLIKDKSTSILLQYSNKYNELNKNNNNNNNDENSNCERDQDNVNNTKNTGDGEKISSSSSSSSSTPLSTSISLNDLNSTSRKRTTIKYKQGSFEASSYDGDEVSIQVVKKNWSYNSNIQQRPRLYERTLKLQQSQQQSQQFNFQPNETLSLWEYFDEIHSPPMLYNIDQNNLNFTNNYIVQEKLNSLDNKDNENENENNNNNQSFTFNKEFIKSVLQSFSTYISSLPNSIHFTDTNIPPSIDYTSPNVLKIHPNLLPIIEIIYNDIDDDNNDNNNNLNDKIFIIYKKYNYTLDGLLRYSSQYLQRNQKITTFMIYQLIQLFSFLHQREIVHGDLQPSNIHLNNQMWLGLEGFSFPSTPLYHQPSENQFETSMNKWINGELSNFNYLMILNRLAHRHIGDPMNHPVIPWVIDFTTSPINVDDDDDEDNDDENNNNNKNDEPRNISGWRDLTKTKYRLNKGDEQLDFQFLNTGNSTTLGNENMGGSMGGGGSIGLPNSGNGSSGGGSGRAHHISDVLSELTYYSYLARRTSVPLLRRFVRTNYEPNEYPATMERLYRWTPDECIPEFFTDSTIFKSIHSDMPDLQLPDWVPNQSAQEFIKIHMNALESDHVSKQLHSWIDLTFGYLLSGEEAIKAKNLALMDTTVPRNNGIVQLFNHPHPKKKYFKSLKFKKQQQQLNQQPTQQQETPQQFDTEFTIKFNENSFRYENQNINNNSTFLPNTTINSILNNLSNVNNHHHNHHHHNNNNSNINNTVASRSDSFGSNSSSSAPGNNILLSPSMSSSVGNLNSVTSSSSVSSSSVSSSHQQTSSTSTGQMQRSFSIINNGGSSGGNKPRTSSGKREGESKPSLAKFLPSIFTQAIKIEKEDNTIVSSSPTNIPVQIDLLSSVNSNYIGYGSSIGNSSTQHQLFLQQQLALQQQQLQQQQQQQLQSQQQSQQQQQQSQQQSQQQLLQQQQIHQQQQQQQQTNSPNSKQLHLIHSKSEESMIKKYSNGLFSSMGISKSTANAPTNSNMGDSISSNITSPPSPTSLKEQLAVASNQQQNNSDSTPTRPVTPPTVSNNSTTDLSSIYTNQEHIIEPLPAELELELYEYELMNKDVSGNANIIYSSSPTNNTTTQPFIIYNNNNTPQNNVASYHSQQKKPNVFIESLLNCELNNEFSYNFEKLLPIYRPLEFKNSNNRNNSNRSELSTDNEKNKGLIKIFSNNKEQSNLEILKSNDMFSLGCIIAELYQGYPLFTSKGLENHFSNVLNNKYGSSSFMITSNLPNNVKEIVDKLIQPNPMERIDANELLSSSLFPTYFKQMYHFLVHYHSLHTPEERLTFTLANIGIVTSLPNESIDLILPFILELFYDSKTMVSALIDLLDPLSQRLGIHLSTSYLLPCLIALYQRHDDHLLQCHLIQIPMIDMIVSRFGRDVYIHHILPFLLDSVKTNPKDNPNHEMLTTALIKISKVLGIPLTIRHMMYPLLVALTKPRLQHLNEPLVAIASSLGENVIVKFYFPSIFILIQKHSSKASRSESIPCTLLSLLQELILLVKPGLVLRSLLKESTQLASLLLNPSNTSLLLPLAETLLRISGRIGVNHTKNFILKYVQQFFSNYSDLYDYSGDNSYAKIGGDSETTKQLRSIYSPEMTYYLYYKLARIIGFEVMRAEISDNSLIEHIMRVYIKENNIKTTNSNNNDNNNNNNNHQNNNSNSNNPNNPNFIPPYVSDDGLYDIMEETLDQKISSTYLLDDYQDYDDLICDKSFTLQGNIVAQYKEHNASIKSLAVSPSEERFISGSKDNLVKIWSLDSTKSLATYNQHMHTAHTVHFVSSLVASCDITSIQVWDPESKIKVNVFYEPTGSFSCFEPISSKYLVASTCESTLSFYDLSMGSLSHEWSLAYQTGQAIRCIATSNDHLIGSNPNQFSSSSFIASATPTWIATGSSSGMITLLDTRTGTILEQWKSHHDGPVNKLIAQGSRYLISCGEKSVIQWDLHQSPPIISKMWKGFKDNITNASLYQNDLIVSSGHKLSSMTLLDDPYQLTSGGGNQNTFRVDGLKLNTPKQSNILSLSFFSLHHILLAGTDDGFIKICQ
ncbi:hypothetical protein ACTFIU_000479 [Dictyostelium citrinum]